MTSTPFTSAAPVVTTVMNQWRDGIASERPADVSGVFTDDALFQGLRPDPLHGPAGVFEYYSGQPVGLQARYQILDARWSADKVITAYLAVDFEFADGGVVSTHLTVVLVKTGARWLIDHYHVSRIG